MSLRHVLPAIALVPLLLLTGCVPDEPPTKDDPASSTPTPTETTEVVEAKPNISSIVVDGDSVYVTETEGGILIDIPFTLDPTTAAAQLSDAIDLEPITTVTPPDSCDGDLTKTTWGAITFVSPYASAPPGVQFYATVDAEKTSNGITVAMLGGQWVGYDGSDTVAAYPGAELPFGVEGSSVLAYDVKSGTADGDPDTFYGAVAIVTADVVKSFSSPIHYWYDC